MVRNEKGVTLVELLIVIVILGIIAAISVPAVGNIVENAEKDALVADATTLQQQAETYCASEDEDICDSEDEDLYFSEEDAEGDPKDGGDASLDEYIDLDDDYQYRVWRDGDSWSVAIETEDYFFAGNPEDASGDDVDSLNGNDLSENSFDLTTEDNGNIALS